MSNGEFFFGINGMSHSTSFHSKNQQSNCSLYVWMYAHKDFYIYLVYICLFIYELKKDFATNSCVEFLKFDCNNIF